MPIKPFIMDHPLIQHKLTWLRDKNTGAKEFRELVNEIATLMCYEATRNLPLEDVEIETPMGPAVTKVISGRKLAFVPILRAGMGMLDGVLAVIILDPMLATGGSAIDAITQIKARGCRSIKFMCIIAAPEGLEALGEAHPDVHIYCASLDKCLNDKKYILPGLGDAGDRIYGTK